MVSRVIPVEPFDLIIFGGTGDLARRKILPALFRRFCSASFCKLNPFTESCSIPLESLVDCSVLVLLCRSCAVLCQARGKLCWFAVFQL